MLAIMVHLFQRKVELNALKATAISIRTNPAHLQLGTRRIPVRFYTKRLERYLQKLGG